MRRYEFTAPDGTRHYRQSSRPFTHGILTREGDRWTLWACVERPDLVRERHERAKRKAPATAVVPAHVIPRGF